MEHKPYILPVPQDFSYAPEITFALHRCRHIVLCISACGCARQSSSLFNHARLLQKSVKEMTGIQIPVITYLTRLKGLHLFVRAILPTSPD